METTQRSTGYKTKSQHERVRSLSVCVEHRRFVDPARPPPPPLFPHSQSNTRKGAPCCGACVCVCAGVCCALVTRWRNDARRGASTRLCDGKRRMAKPSEEKCETSARMCVCVCVHMGVVSAVRGQEGLVMTGEGVIVGRERQKAQLEKTPSQAKHGEGQPPPVLQPLAPPARWAACVLCSPAPKGRGRGEGCTEKHDSRGTMAQEQAPHLPTQQ